MTEAKCIGPRKYRVKARSAFRLVFRHHGRMGHHDGTPHVSSDLDMT